MKNFPTAQESKVKLTYPLCLSEKTEQVLSDAIEHAILEGKSRVETSLSGNTISEQDGRVAAFLKQKGYTDVVVSSQGYSCFDSGGGETVVKFSF